MTATPRKFETWTPEEWLDIAMDYPWRRLITSVHVHHTWRPNYEQWKGLNSMIGMWKYHTQENGWTDIAQHLTIDPEGKLWSGRSWNRAPASSTGYNGTSLRGPFMFEMVGDFDTGRDVMTVPQRMAALHVTGFLVHKFGLKLDDIHFHREMCSKTCPGSSLNKDAFKQAVRDYMDKHGW